MQDKYIIVKYLRLSLEDGDSPESDSIKNQRTLLDNHISFVFKDIDYEIIELIDDGYTGTNFNRPDFKKLLVLAETHQIHCVIVKDFSRFARDYIEVGRYMDIIFPKLQIRFISVNNNYDSKDYAGTTGGLDVVITNLTYAMYSQDLSEKIKSVRKMKYQRGEYISNYAIYGYMKNPENTKQLIVDPEAAEVVKRIYLMRYQQMQYKKIAIILNQEGILSPSMYKKSKGITNRDWTGLNTKAYWCDAVVRVILNDERYTGKMIARKSKQPLGSTKRIYLEKEQYYIVENTHEAIISQELFDSVQLVNTNKTTKAHNKKLFTGLLRCGGCNHLLTQSGKNYYCRHNDYVGSADCLGERIGHQELLDVVGKAIETELLKTADIIKAQSEIDAKSKMHRSKVQHIQNQIDRLKRKKVDGYIKLTKGEISDEEFQAITTDIEKQIALCNEQMQMQQEKTLSAEDLSVLQLFGKYVGIKELTNEILSDVIKSIYVYNDKRIKIVWNFKERLVENVICEEKETSA